jgi:four helix bundle protein
LGVSDFRKLKVWQKAHVMAVNAYRVATKIRQKDLASLRNQLIRAALSVPTNIVEGSGQESAKEFARFLRYAINSSRELEYHMIIGREFDVISNHDSLTLRSQIVEVRKMLHGLIKRLRDDESPS